MTQPVSVIAQQKTPLGFVQERFQHRVPVRDQRKIIHTTSLPPKTPKLPVIYAQSLKQRDKRSGRV